jgi:asparagine synthase (glutamine-hydrolysing)
VSLLGGIVHHEHARPVPRPLLETMAARVAGAGEPLIVAAGPVGLFTAAGAKPPKRSEATIAAADLDLVNLAEVRALTGLVGTCEVLARLYELEGAQGLRRLRGAFAVALWDAQQAALWLAVDHFGMRRLYYATTAHGVVFASRPSALLAVPGIGTAVDPGMVYQYLNFGFVPAPDSAFAGIRRLPPGHLLVIRDGRATESAYWDVEYPERRLGRREGAAVTRQMVEESVSAALTGAPVKDTGAFLSGGTDSSTVLGYMARLSGERVNAFSIGFREERYDELHYADLAARRFGAAHYKHIIAPDEALAALPRLVEAYDEPFGNNSAIGTYFCARLARECGVTRLLAGDGGDEIFGGNERYASDRVFDRYQRIPGVLRRHVLEPILGALPAGGGTPIGKAQRYVRRARIPNPRRLYSYRFFFAGDGQALLAPELLGACDLEAPWHVVERHFARARATSELNRIMYMDMKLTLADNDLHKVTRTADLAGVEVRFPFLDRLLVEFTGTLPADFKVRGMEKRYLFKRAFRELLPAEILAKRKHGFGVPTSDWLRDHAGFRDLARDTLLSPWARSLGYFAPGGLERLFALHTTDTTPYHGDQLWAILMFHLWYRQHVEGRAA